MRAPLFLNPGDTIGIVAPAGKIVAESLHHAVEIISAWGLKVVIGKSILSNAHSYFSASDDDRLADLQEMLDRQDVRAVFCARGGYGLTRIVDRIDFASFLQQPKWIVGFSDITALHLKLSQLGVESIHGPMLLHFFKPEYLESVQQLKKMMFGQATQINAPFNAMNRWGEAKGETMGGNLSLLVDSLGTKTSPDTQNKILVIEEIGEYKYKIDRMFTQLKRSGKLDHLAALIVGYMTDIKDADPGFVESIENIVLDKVKDYQYPVAFNFPTGHEAPNMPWKHGAQASLILSEDGSTLKFNA